MLDIMSIDEDPTPVPKGVRLSAWRDWLGITASIGCAIHCAAMPFVFAYLPAMGLSVLADEVFHKWMALVCFLIAIAAFVPGIRKHGRWLPVGIASVGLVMITFAAFGLAGECCPSCESGFLSTDQVADANTNLGCELCLDEDSATCSEECSEEDCSKEETEKCCPACDEKATPVTVAQASKELDSNQSKPVDSKKCCPACESEKTSSIVSVKASANLDSKLKKDSNTEKCCPACDKESLTKEPIAEVVSTSECDKCEDGDAECSFNGETKLFVQQASILGSSWFSGLAPWVTPLGGLLLVSAHLLNRRYGCLCKCCGN